MPRAKPTSTPPAVNHGVVPKRWSNHLPPKTPPTTAATSSPPAAAIVRPRVIRRLGFSTISASHKKPHRCPFDSRASVGAMANLTLSTRFVTKTRSRYTIPRCIINKGTTVHNSRISSDYRAKQPISSIPQTRKNIAVAIEFLVHRGGIYRNLRMTQKNSLNTGLSRNHRNQNHLTGPFAL